MSQNTFITNQDKLLAEIINGILPKTQAVDMLVGYFYYSGYDLLSKGLADKNIRILVGLDVDTQITKHIREINALTSSQQSRGQIREDYFAQFVKLFNESDFLDSDEKLASFKFFYEKIKNGTLEIRKTEDPCHAKLYIFEYSDLVNEGGELPGSVITGSSNLSYAGLAGRIEINARFNDKHTFIDARKIFDALWDQQSRGQIREDYFAQFVKLFNESDFLDSDEKLASFKFFYEKIKNGTLEIRKTEDPCHAKLYIFEYSDLVNEGGELPGSVITGSSNLSYAGLAGRIEINARFNDKHTFIDARKIFDALWDTSVVLIDENTVEEFNDKVIKKIWYEKLYAPYLMYIRVLNEYFAIPTKENVLTPYDITDGRYSNLKYQTDAVQLALNAIENHNGAIVADVVGLGKSVIASTVARNLKLRTIVICPPHLSNQWETYKDEFGFTASVYSGGRIEQALNHFQEIKRDGEQFLIVIDEAHRYRNEYTQDYANLHNLCSGNKVLLLTATPFNNRPDDIYSMLKLFQIPSKSTLRTVENLGIAFRDLIDAYKKLRENQRKGNIGDAEVKLEAERIAKSIRSIISPLVVRRSRVDLTQIPQYKEDLDRQGIQLIVPNDPIELEYDLSSVRELYLETLDLIDGSTERPDGIYRFKAARYSPVLYVPAELKGELADELEKKTGVEFNLLVGRQANVSKFMRHLLVCRFESSVAAFKSSLDFMIKSSENILDWVHKCNKVPIYKKGNLPLVEDFYTDTEDGMTEIEDALEQYNKRGFFDIDMKYIDPRFVEDVKKDIELLKAIRYKWFGAEGVISVDPKLESFKAIIAKSLKEDPKRKIIVFSEFADTADYVGQILADAGFPVFKYTSKDASQANKDRVRANFDAGLKKSLQKDDYQILVATDAI